MEKAVLKVVHLGCHITLLLYIQLTDHANDHIIIYPASPPGILKLLKGAAGAGANWMIHFFQSISRLKWWIRGGLANLLAAPL